MLQPHFRLSCMNEVFMDYMRKFVLVFFDDILIYSDSLDSHLQHLRIVFETLKQHKLFVKKSKYLSVRQG